jgi:hypothetical protein
MLSTIATAASVPLGTGLVVGAAVAILGIFMAPDLEATADFAANAFWVLALLMPLALWLGIYMTHGDEDHAEAYGSLFSTTLVALQAAIFGAALGAGPFYFLAVSYLSAILRGFEAPLLSQALNSQILWGPWLWVIAITALASLPIAFWSYRTNNVPY